MAPRAETASPHDLNGLAYPIVSKSPSARKSEFPKLPNAECASEMKRTGKTTHFGMKAGRA
jgi:hypothetical protein